VVGKKPNQRYAPAVERERSLPELKNNKSTKGILKSHRDTSEPPKASRNPALGVSASQANIIAARDRGNYHSDAK